MSVARLMRPLRSLLWLSLACLGAISACSSDPMAQPAGAGGSVAGRNAAAGGPARAGSPSGGATGESPEGAAGESPEGPAGGASGSVGEAGAPGEVAGAAATGDVIPVFNGCTQDNYEDRRASEASRSIGIATMGLSFTPKCMIVSVGQTVRWEGNLSAHPLAPGNPDHPDAGSIGNPVVETAGGQSVEFSFTTPGTFPYQCEIHAFGDGKGMAGVVHVMP